MRRCFGRTFAASSVSIAATTQQRWCAEAAPATAAAEGGSKKTNGQNSAGGGSSFMGKACGFMLFPLLSYAGAYYTGTMDMFWAMQAAKQEQQLEIKAIEARPNLGGSFEMTDANTKKLVNEKDVFDGHWTLLYFGFTKCAEICPNTMKFIANVVDECDKQYKKENPKEVEQLRVCFLSVDHVRDDPDTVDKWLQQFNTKCIGLCGTQAQIGTAAKAWRVYYSSLDESEEEKEAREAKGLPPPVLDEQYQFDHSAAIYLVGPDGKMKDFFFREIGVETTVERMKFHFDDLYGINS